MKRRLAPIVPIPRPEASFGSAVATRRVARSSGLVGRMEIEELGVSAIVVEAAAMGALRRSLRHMEGTAFPGEPGHATLAGHGDSSWRRLKGLTPGDELRIETPDGVFSYEIESVDIVQAGTIEAGDPDQPTPTLTLVTGYPFHCIGPAPQQFRIRARLAGEVRSPQPDLGPRIGEPASRFVFDPNDVG